MNFEFEAIKEIPQNVLKRGLSHKGEGKWQPLRDRVNALTIESPAVRVKFGDKVEARRAAQSIQGYKGKRGGITAVAGHAVVVRTAPVNGNNDGPWYMYAAIVPIDHK